MTPEETPDMLSARVQIAALCNIPACRCQEEDTPDSLRVHIYTTSNKKLGIVKISKQDCQIIFRNLFGGSAAECVLDAPEEFLAYVHS